MGFLRRIGSWFATPASLRRTTLYDMSDGEFEVRQMLCRLLACYCKPCSLCMSVDDLETALSTLLDEGYDAGHRDALRESGDILALPQVTA